MTLIKCKIGDFVKTYNKKCGISNLSKNDIHGINRIKEFFSPVTQIGKDTSNYKEVPQGYFACNLMHVGRDVVLPIAINKSDEIKIVSPAYTVFKIVENDFILADYFYIFLCCFEKDRFFWFHTDSSVREGLEWEVFCNLEIELPPIKIQQKYVDIYNALIANQKAYEKGLEDLKLTCDAYIEDLRRKNLCEAIGSYINRHDVRNGPNGTKNVMGVSTTKEFHKPTSKVNKNELSNYKVVKPHQISFVQTTHNEKVFCNALNNTEDDIVVTSVNEVFSTDENKLLPEYLVMFLNRTEFDRYARFHSWGSARETFTWNDLIKVKIPIVDINIQKTIVNVFNVYKQRKKINEKLKVKISNICPVLIKGSILEAQKGGC